VQPGDAGARSCRARSGRLPHDGGAAGGHVPAYGACGVGNFDGTQRLRCDSTAQKNNKISNLPFTKNRCRHLKRCLFLFQSA